MPLKTRSTYPPGGRGWEFVQKDGSGGTLKKFEGMMPFGQFCAQILRFRQANKLNGASAMEVEKEVDDAQCERLGHDPMWCQKKTGGLSSYVPSRLFKAVASHVRHAGATLSTLSEGIKVLKDWHDEGFEPTDQQTAQNRADICTGRLNGSPCQYNAKLPFPIPQEVESILQSHIEKKNGLKLAVLGEDNLKECRVCLCFLKLKVFVPLDTILAQQPPNMLERFPSYCWLKTKDGTETPKTP